MDGYYRITYFSTAINSTLLFTNSCSKGHWFTHASHLQMNPKFDACLTLSETGLSTNELKYEQKICWANNTIRYRLRHYHGHRPNEKGEASDNFVTRFEKTG